ncbi:MAG: caspase family protein [Gammaproteobacteria bacterium]|nr:caspase family protein [Gammaproteobacteria bacterium]
MTNQIRLILNGATVFLSRSLLGLVLMQSTSAHAEMERVALVIGNKDYNYAPLINTVNDANVMAETLKNLGFDVIKKTDLDYQQMLVAIEKFKTKLQARQNGVGLVFFAGHGVSIKGVNYLLPIGKKYNTEAEVEQGAVNIDLVMQSLKQGKSRVGFVVLDACRDNPFGEAKSRSISMRGEGLARMDPPTGTLIAYATAPGSIASDGSGKNGLFTSHLVNNLHVPGITAEQIFKRTREGVEKESLGEQSPREETALKGEDFYFLPLKDADIINPEAVELIYWQSINNSEDLNDYQNYLQKYPKGKFVDLAKNRLNRLNGITQTDPDLYQAGLAYTAKNRGDSQTAEDMFSSLTKSSNSINMARGYEGLASLALENNNLEQAVELVEKALQLRPNSSLAFFIRAQIVHRKGDTGTARKLLESATNSKADFSWQKSKALVASGNLKRNENTSAAVQDYKAALKINPMATEAVTNLATLYHQLNQSDEALELLNQNRTSVDDRIADALAYQIQQDLRQKRDHNRQKQIDDSVKALIDRKYQLDAKSVSLSTDDWTTPPISVSVLGFHEKSSAMTGRIGMDILLGQELERVLRVKNIVVVDRAVIEKVLNELKLGSSELADPETQLKLGRLTSARLISVGNLYNLNGRNVVSYRVIDTETTQIVHSTTESLAGQLDPVVVSDKLANVTKEAIDKRYPVKGRIALVDQDQVIINLGSKHGLLSGDIYQVLGEPEIIKFRDKVIGHRDIILGKLRVAVVDDEMSFAVPLENTNNLQPEMRIIRTNN